MSSSEGTGGGPAGMRTAPRGPSCVVIIGGGLSGAAVAWHLARRTRPGEIRIIIVEPRAELGRGLAYATPDPDHRLNVPERKMSLDAGDPLHFQRWLLSREGPGVPHGAWTAEGEAFVPREIFGRYVAHHLRPLLASGRVEHLRAQATGVQQRGQGYAVRLDGGGEVVADRVVLAVAHPAPAVPGALAAFRDDPRLVADAYGRDALSAIAPSDRVLIVGSGLTGADVVATLRRCSHRASIHMLSRHGRRSQPHGPAQSPTSADFTQPGETRAVGLLRRVRRELERDAQAGRTWHAVFDRLREQGPRIWAALPWPERRRVVRHLRGLWDIHRFRIAPQTYQALQSEIAAGRLEPLAGRLVSAQSVGASIAVRIALRGGASRVLEVERIVIATGPAHGSVIAANPVLKDLAAQGLLQSDPLGLGLWTSPQGVVLDRYGVEQPNLLVAGPLARGSVGELMGVPEVTAWAEAVAARVAGAPAEAPGAQPIPAGTP
ncbi:FAD/NAD(P)-binding protein [Xanthobacter variabilis]|uniref:FAD/NAD(P)-binding protein n=1 Tax=Xanthobacter variabilis TaxID=3119932 RepID=UPI00374E37D7